MRLAPLLLLAGLLASAAASPATAADRRVNIINRSGQTMVEFYASNTRRDSWEEDILGQDTLAHGATQRIDIDDGSGACRFDFKAVFEDGSSSVRRNVDVCSITDFTYTK